MRRLPAPPVSTVKPPLSPSQDVRLGNIYLDSEAYSAARARPLSADQGRSGSTRGLPAGEEVEVGLGQGGRVLQRDVVTGVGDDGAADVAGHVGELPGYFAPEVSLPADGQDRAADRVGVVRAVLLGVGLAGAVHLQDGRGAARLLGRVHDFVDVLLGQRAGVPHLAPGVVSPERAFPPGQQQLGYVRQAEEAEVPAGADVVGGERGVGFAARQSWAGWQSWQERFLEHHLLYPGPVEGGDGVGDGLAPVLADDAELLEAQVGGQFGDVT